jgi:GTP-binding protein HflX
LAKSQGAGETPRSKAGRDSGQGGPASTGRAVVVVPVLTRHQRPDDDHSRPRLGRSPKARLDEALGLTLAIDLEPVHSEIVMLADPRPATLIGSGKLEEFATIVRESKAELAIVDHPLTPVQQRNLEKALNAKVLDRTGLILEIFGERARTKEGALQVELAHLEYQKGRLVRSWTHLERQRGGAGFLGGPGETQIEADRRILQEKILRLKRDLEGVRRTRDLHRAKRKKVPFPVVAVVGYTNAGKSTLFNRLTGAGVVAEDMLFATLDPTLRRLKLPHGTTMILSDTVGFISDLPTHLIAAFRATLEEVVEADLVLHLRDISDPDTAAQAEDVERILADLGVDASNQDRVIEVWNKVDLIDAANRERLLEESADPERGPPIAVSAVTGEGIPALVELIEARLSGGLEQAVFDVPPQQLGMVDWLYRNGEVLRRTDNEDGSVTLTMRVTAAAKHDIERRLYMRKAAE